MASNHAQVITVRLDGVNYAYWAPLMTDFSKGRKLWNYVPIKNLKSRNQIDPAMGRMGI